MTALDDHIQKMRDVARAAVHMMNKTDAENMAANVTEDIVVKTITMMRDHPEWMDEAWKRAVIHSPTPRLATPPPKKRRIRHTLGQGSGESHETAPAPTTNEISLDDLKL